VRSGRLVFEERFDQPAGSPPNPHHWVAEIGGGGWGCGQKQVYTASTANAAVDDQQRLAITARCDNTGEITSARLTTKDRVTTRFGRVAARIRVPGNAGTWPAFWMLGTDIDAVGWPACGEIDVMEVVGSDPRRVHGTIHLPGAAGVRDGLGYAHDTGVDLAANFHIYAIDWQPDQITWSFDGQPYHRVTPADTPERGWPFHHPFYLLVNLAVGGDWPGLAGHSPALPAKLVIDWIRIWSRN
jgi:beta-glucanase (GH16 family)